MMAIVTGDRYLESLVKFVEKNAEALIEGSLVLKLNPVGLRYVHSRLEALAELESLIAGAPVDYLRAYVSDLGDHRAIEQLRRILRLLHSIKVVSMLPPPGRDPTPLSLLPFARLKVLELRGCDLSTSAAQGLLELRHTLEKLICHNSTDALRHVFASRITDIKDSPQWNRLSFVSCARNSLVLMDESLQLLPAVETLDLSRNKFSKVDNLRKCTKLKHLDLGFNQLRTIASFSEVSCHIVKLVLRNNALTSLRGIENLRSLEELDLSYNIISNFSEMEILAGLPSLQSLWLEGNPLCNAGWYRAQVFSFFLSPERLKLDKRKISTREFWKRQIIIASRQERPASFGFYAPAKDGADLAGNANTKRKKISRLVSIESEQSTSIFSDRDTLSCDNESQSKEENANSDMEAEVLDLMNRIEYMKKERSALWLQDFKEWIDSENCRDDSEYRQAVSRPEEHNNLQSMMRDEHLAETSKNISEFNQASGDESGTNLLESDSSFADTSTGLSSRGYFGQVGEVTSSIFMGHSIADSQPVIKSVIQSQEHLIALNSKVRESLNRSNSHFVSMRFASRDKLTARTTMEPETAVDDIIESQSSSACPGSPPHYQEDILQRRQNLEEEFLQLSAESVSVASSDSDTSCSNDDSSGHAHYVHEFDQFLINKFSGSLCGVVTSPGSKVDHNENDSSRMQNGVLVPGTFEDNLAYAKARRYNRSSSSLCRNASRDNSTSSRDEETVWVAKQEDDFSEKKTRKKKPKRRIVSLTEEGVSEKREPLQGSSENLDTLVDDDEAGPRTCDSTNFSQSVTNISTWTNRTKSRDSWSRNLVGNYFNSNIADSAVSEICKQYTCCSCLFQDNSGWQESEVAVLQSSEEKLYILLVGGTCDGSGSSLQQIGCHRIEEVKEVFVGLGLQVVRVCFESDAPYLFITRSADISRQLLSILDVSESHSVRENFSLKSLELVQVDLFERHVCGCSSNSIFQYSMVSFWRNNLDEDLWLSRSLFVLEGHLLVCVEHVNEFGLLSDDSFSSPYFSLHWCCSIPDVTEMVIETKEDLCVTLSLERDKPFFRAPEQQQMINDSAPTKLNLSPSPSVWKFKWLSEEGLNNFVALLKAISAGMLTSSLSVHH